jgi:hypothetical protein
MITITSGDTTPLSLTAATGGTAFDLTGATFQTLIKGVAGVRTIPMASTRSCRPPPARSR